MASPNSISQITEAGSAAAEPLRALRRGLARADGFALYVAVVKTPAQRNQLITLLGEAMPGMKLQTVTIGKEATDILDEIHRQLGSKISGPVMVVGLEDLLSSDTQSHPILNSLNLRRSDWPQLIPQPVVFWLPEYLLGLFARSAPDFLDWRSDTLHFPDTEIDQFQVLHSATWEGGMDTRMPAIARIERIKELESRITTNENNIDPVIRSTVATWLNELGLHLALMGRTHEAVVCFQKLLSMLRKTGNQKFVGIVLGNLAVAHRNIGNARKAIELFEQQLKIARESNDLEAESNATEGLALAYKDLGDTQNSLESHNKALAIYRQMGNRRSEGHSLNNLGIAYKNLGDLQKAIELYEQSLSIKEQTGDRRGAASCFGNLGIVYARLGDIHKSVEFQQRALAIYRELGDRRGEVTALGNLSVSYKNLGEVRKAIELQEEQVVITRETGDRRNEGGALWNSAVAYDILGEREKAIPRAEAALKIFEAIEDPNAAKVRAALAEWRKQA